MKIQPHNGANAVNVHINDHLTGEIPIITASLVSDDNQGNSVQIEGSTINIELTQQIKDKITELHAIIEQQVCESLNIIKE